MKKIFTLLLIGLSINTIAQTHVVISQVYGGGGNTGATFRNDFIELYNPTSAAIDITGWTLQYSSSTSTTFMGTNLSTTLNGIIGAGKYFLVQEAAGTGGTTDLPIPDQTGVIAMGANGGKVALANNNTIYTVKCPIGNISLIDFVGYGSTADCFETARTAAVGNAIAVIRNAGNNNTDSDNNSLDFSAINPPTPRNSSFGVLSTTLENFSASKTSNAITINWLVGCLGNSVTFELQRSYNAVSFTTFYTATETKLRCASPFDFKDINAGNGTVYYRLKILDLDGGGKFSNIATVENGFSKKYILTVSPTIATTNAEIYYTSDNTEKVNWIITDMQGRQVKSMSTLVVVGNNKITIPIATLTQGQYLIKGFTSAGGIDAAVFMKQ